MITTRSAGPRYCTTFSDGKHEGCCDTTPDKGGGADGFRPHDLLEAALASCLNISVRMFSEKHGIPLSGVTTTVTLNREMPEESTFEYAVELEGTLTDAERRMLLDAASNCPVRRTLSKKLSFRPR